MTIARQPKRFKIGFIVGPDGLRIDAVHGPSSGAVEDVGESIVQSAGATLPELHAVRDQSITTPVGRARNRSPSEPLSEFFDPSI